jgi:hypothetical protein
MTVHCMMGHWFMEAIRTRLRLVSSMLEGNIGLIRLGDCILV